MSFSFPRSGPATRGASKETQRQFAFRVEEDRIVLATSEGASENLQPITIDCARFEDADENGNPIVARLGNPSSRETWIQAIEVLKARHDIDRTPVAVTLSGDFCVTRISTGAVEVVNDELEMLSGRIPRYLQLGPGDKVTGHTRDTVAPGIDHALTAVGNHERLQWLYEVFEACEIEIAWMEPSLVSLARLTGWLGLDSEKPILIADSFGKSWEVGIVHGGRLLLDYRPAAAYDSKRFATAIDEHLSRLRRFCQRHRGIDQSDLGQIFLGGDREKMAIVLTHFADIEDLQALPLAINIHSSSGAVSPTLNFYQEDETDGRAVKPDGNLDQDAIAAVAAILPLITTQAVQAPPDLLQSIRRARGRSNWQTMVMTWWPAVAAAVILVTGFGLVASKRRHFEVQNQKREFVETQMRQTRVRMASIQSDHSLIEHLETIQDKLDLPNIAILVQQITQCLPPNTRLQAFRLDGEHQIHLTGLTSNESEIYETVGYFRRLPSIDQVALLGTAVNVEENGSEFHVRLHWSSLDE